MPGDPDATLGPTVSVSNVSHRYGAGEAAKHVLTDNNIELSPGEILIMSGPSGAGKTTLLTLIGGLRSVQQGSIRVLGRELANLDPARLVEVRRNIGFIFQGHNLMESLTARENVNLAIELHPHDPETRDSRAAEILDKLGLGERLDHKPHQLSGGQKQRVAIARALVNKPKLILADEPTAALDKESGRDVVNLLKSLAADEGATIIIVTHDNRILDVADRIVNMVDGRIVSDVAVRRTGMIVEFLSKIELFSKEPLPMLVECAERMQRETFEQGAALITEGEVGDKFYLISSGTVNVTRLNQPAGAPEVVLKPGDFFGEVALLTANPRNATIVARENVEVFTLPKADFEKAMARSQTLDESLREFLSRRA